MPMESDDIMVTPAMIEAGLLVYDRYGLRDFDSGELATNIYRAMVGAGRAEVGLGYTLEEMSIPQPPLRATWEDGHADDV